MTIYETFGRRVRERREQLGLTNADVYAACQGKTIPKSQQHTKDFRQIVDIWAGHFYRGGKQVGLATLVQLADALQCSTDYLLGRTETP